MTTTLTFRSTPTNLFNEAGHVYTSGFAGGNERVTSTYNREVAGSIPARRETAGSSVGRALTCLSQTLPGITIAAVASCGLLHNMNAKHTLGIIPRSFYGSGNRMRYFWIK